MLYCGMALTLLLIFGVSFYSGKKVSNASDFDSGSKKAGSVVVAGAVMGTLVGGSSTIGTAQLAYNYGMSAWWFTLGGGIACLILAFIYAVPMRKAGQKTIVGIISAQYGKKSGVAASVLSSVGTFINILSQIISASAVITILIPGLPVSWTYIAVAVLMIIYVIFGGVLGAGMVGIVKLLLLYLSVVAGAVIVLMNCNGIGLLYNSLDHRTYFNLFARGIGTDGGAALSLILGVLSTQSYAQAILAGRTDQDAVKGSLISAFMIPPIGIGGILIGLYMRVKAPELVSAKMAFPQFVLENFPPIMAGVILATLLIAVIGTGAGLSLGIGSMVRNDIVRSFTDKFDAPDKGLRFSRIFIVIVLGAACVLCMLPIGDTILNFAFMSMGLRGAVVFIPLCCALWIKDRISPEWVVASIIAGPAVVLLFGLLDVLSFDPLFLGILTALMISIAGIIKNRLGHGNGLT